MHRIREESKSGSENSEKGNSVSHEFLSILHELGIKYVFMNAGTDYAPIIEAFSEYSSRGVKTVEPVVVPHEGPAVGMAIGYYMLTGEPQAVMVHTTPGTANSLANILNAQSMNIPIILLAGRTPVTEGSVFGSKDIPVHWNQELRDQGEMLRQFTKWDWEHRFGEQLQNELVRAYEVAMSDPRGPVYLTLPRERISEKSVPQGRRLKPKPVEPTVPDPDRLKEIAGLLVDSERPVVLTSQLGRNNKAPGELLHLAETLALPVSQNFYYMNFPTASDLFIGGLGSRQTAEYLKSADVVLMIDVDVPWFPKTAVPSEDAKVVHIDVDPLKLRMPTWGFHSDIRVRGNSEEVLRLMNLEAKKLLEGNTRAIRSIDERRQKISRDHASMVKGANQEAMKHKDDSPIDPIWLSHCIGSVLNDNMLIFTETVRSPFYEYVPMNRTRMSFSTPPFGSLGWSMGAALGAKLASPEKDVLALMGDGSYMYNSPVSSHFVSRSMKLPILTIVYNNQSWLASKAPVSKMYPSGTAVRTNNFPGTELNPSPDFELVAKSSGAFSRKITEPGDIIPALRESLDHMHDMKNQAFLNVVLKHPL